MAQLAPTREPVVPSVPPLDLNPTGHVTYVVQAAVPERPQTCDWTIGDRITDLDEYFAQRAAEARAAGTDPAAACWDDFYLISEWMRRAIARHTEPTRDGAE